MGVFIGCVGRGAGGVVITARVQQRGQDGVAGGGVGEPRVLPLGAAFENSGNVFQVFHFLQQTATALSGETAVFMAASSV